MYVTMSIAFRLLIAASNITGLFNARPLAVAHAWLRQRAHSRVLAPGSHLCVCLVWCWHYPDGGKPGFGVV